MKPQDRDRLLQVHLAQARGPLRNGNLVRQAFDRMLRIRAMTDPVQRSRNMDDALVQALKAVTDALEQVRARYAVTGSIASGVHGEPVMSQDVDLIVLATAAQAASLSGVLMPRFYAPEDMLTDAAKQESFVNVIDNLTGSKIDLSFVGADEFLTEVLERRVRSQIGVGSPEFWLVTPEDVILMKLLWRKETQSTKQWDNALSVARVRGARMDWNYLFKKAGEIGVEDQLIKLRDEAGI